MDIPAEVVDRDYIANTNNGEQIMRGPMLQEGMIVLIEGTLNKANPTSDFDACRALISNRWCMITDLNFDDLGESGTLVCFTGQYHNGDIVERHYNAQYAWVVKTESIPEEPQGMTFSQWIRNTYAPVNTGIDPWNYLTTTPTAQAAQDWFQYADEPAQTTADALGMTVITNAGITFTPDPALDSLIADEEGQEVTWNPLVEDLP